MGDVFVAHCVPSTHHRSRLHTATSSSVEEVTHTHTSTHTEKKSSELCTKVTVMCFARVQASFNPQISNYCMYVLQQTHLSIKSTKHYLTTVAFKFIKLSYHVSGSRNLLSKSLRRAIIHRPSCWSIERFSARHRQHPS